MGFFLLILLVGFFVWLYVSQRKKTGRRHDVLRAEALYALIDDTLHYVTPPPLTLEEAKAEIASGKTLDEVCDEVSDTVIEDLTESPRLYLGRREANLCRGLKVEEDYLEAREAIQTHSDLERFEREAPDIEAELEVFRHVAGGRFPVVQPAPLRDRHTYVIGKTGSGKSTLLTWMMYQDAMSDQGFAFLAPEAETIEEDLLPYLPSWRFDDVIYFNPADEQNRHHFNPLHLEEGDDLDRRAEEVYALFSRLMLGDQTPRIAQILRHAIYALLEVPDTTLLDLPALLSREDAAFRREVAAAVRDARTRAFWEATYDTYPKNAHLPILTRLAAFLRPRRVRNVLCRKGRGLDMRSIMDEGKILLCNLSDGLLGEATSRLLGGLLMAELQLAAIGRADAAPRDRRRFYIYLDEFQSFVAQGSVSYEKLLSRSRKYGTPIVLAHQQTGQIPPSLLQEILGNVATIVAFQLGRRDANRISSELILDTDLERPTVEPQALTLQSTGRATIRLGRYAFPLIVDETLRTREPDDVLKDDILARSRRDGEAGAHARSQTAREAAAAGKERKEAVDDAVVDDAAAGGADEQPEEDPVPAFPFGPDFDPGTVY